MRTILAEDQALPAGLWLIKWIDCISLGRGLLSSPRIHIVLQQLKQPTMDAVSRLSSLEICYLLGRKPGQNADDFPARTESRQVLVGMLPLLRIGDIVRGTRIEGSLRKSEYAFSIGGDSEVESIGIFDECTAPKDWSGKYRALNRFEYELGKSREVSGSRCLKFRAGEIEYIIPDVVIFRTFYGFHTRIANAICSGPWSTSCAELISTSNYESGIGTYVDTQTGDWNIVVQHGLTHDHAVRLAPLYFDEYAKACTNAIYAAATRQTHAVRADGDRRWFVEAKIPYPWPLEMRVKALLLRRYRPSSTDGKRLLVTEIVATSWPFTDKKIFSELANSNATSEKSNPEKIQSQYFGIKPKPIEADPDALIDHGLDAWELAPDNLVEAAAFHFLNQPLHGVQIKKSHKEYLGSSSPPDETSNLVLSAGNLSPGKEKPAPLVAEPRDQRAAPQLQLLHNALQALLEAGEISNFEILGPPESSHLRPHRSGLSCWSFVSEQQARAIRSGRIATGWEFIFEPTRMEGRSRRPIPRCLLVVRIQLSDHELVLFEIEPRASELAYRYYVLEATETVDSVAIETVLVGLRSFSGRVPGTKMQETFCALTRHSPIASNHSYIRNDQKEIVGLNTGSLLRALSRACIQ